MTMLEILARRGHQAAIAVLDAFDPDQPRDENGMWSASGGSGTGASSTSQHEGAISFHSSSAEKARSSGNGKAAALHERARQAHLDVIHKETGKNHLLGSQGMKSVEELRSEAQKASHAAHEDDARRMQGPMPAGWKPGVGYRPGLNDPKPRPTDDERDELTTVNFRGGGKGVTVTTAGKLSDPSTRTLSYHASMEHSALNARVAALSKTAREDFDAWHADTDAGGIKETHGQAAYEKTVGRRLDEIESVKSGPKSVSGKDLSKDLPKFTKMMAKKTRLTMVESRGHAMPSGWKPGVGYRPGLNDPKPREIDNAKEELTTMNFRGGGKGVTVMRAGDLPKGDEPRSRFNAGPSDPAAEGSRAVKGTDPSIQRSHDFMKDLEAKRAGDKPVDWNKYTVPFGSPRTKEYPKREAVHGGSERRTPYNRKEGTARERKELRETRSMEAAAKIFAKPGQTSLKQDFVSRSRPIGSGVKK